MNNRSKLKPHRRVSTLAFLAIGGLLAIASSDVSGQVYYPEAEGVTNESTGFVWAKADGSWFRGSGVIARDPRLIYTCAHLLYERGQWSTERKFFRAYNSSSVPGTGGGVAVRGFRYFSSYSSNSSQYGGSSKQTFDVDFAIMYSPSSFGPAVSWWSDGAAAMRSGRWKRIVGYPAVVDWTGASGRAYQHTTPYFTTSANQTYGSYYGLRDVSTGSGNSGGPVFVNDGNRDALAGILVSGTYSSAGIRVIDSSADTMATNAIGSAGGTPSPSPTPPNGGGGGGGTSRTRSNNSVIQLPDASSSFTARNVTFSGMPGRVTAISVSAYITTTYRGDLEVYLRAPNGRIRWVSRRAGGSAENLRVTNANYIGTYRGLSPNGIWSLRVRDAAVGDRATFRSFSLKITSK